MKDLLHVLHWKSLCGSESGMAAVNCGWGGVAFACIGNGMSENGFGGRGGGESGETLESGEC